MLSKEQVSPYLQKLEPEPTGLRPSCEPKENIRCILFDIYGTLFISATGDIGLLQADTVKRQLLQDLLKDFGLETTATRLIESLTVEIKKIHAQKKAQGVDYPEVNITDVWCKILNKVKELTLAQIEDFAIRFELIVNPVYPMPGLEDCLRWCEKNHKLMGIISNAQFYTPLLFSWFLNAAPHQLGFRENLLFYSYEHKVAKPSSVLFEKATRILQKEGIENGQVAYLGNDMLKDMLPAKRAGFQTALFAGDSRSLRLRKDVPDCQGLVPDMIITHLNQLTNW